MKKTFKNTVKKFQTDRSLCSGVVGGLAGKKPQPEISRWGTFKKAKHDIFAAECIAHSKPVRVTDLGRIFVSEFGKKFKMF
jgi:hypothetical protein